MGAELLFNSKIVDEGSFAESRLEMENASFEDCLNFTSNFIQGMKASLIKDSNLSEEIVAIALLESFEVGMDGLVSEDKEDSGEPSGFDVPSFSCEVKMDDSVKKFLEEVIGVLNKHGGASKNEA